MGVLAAGAPRIAFAQKPMPRVGFLVAGDPEPAWSLFRKAMTDLGHVEGRTIAYEYRAADADSARLDQFAAELVRLKVDVLVPILSPSIVAARKATSTIPIVFFGAAPDIGGVTNVARPEAKHHRRVQPELDARRQGPAALSRDQARDQGSSARF